MSHALPRLYHARTICLPAYMLILFLAAAFAVALIAVAIIMTLSG